MHKSVELHLDARAAGASNILAPRDSVVKESRHEATKRQRVKKYRALFEGRRCTTHHSVVQPAAENKCFGGRQCGIRAAREKS